MEIINKNGYKYFDLGNGEFALVIDDNGMPMKTDKRWKETETDFIFVPNEEQQ